MLKEADPVRQKMVKENKEDIQQIYINEGYDKSEINWKLITAILKKLLEDNMCYSGIIYTLWYCKEIINIDLLFLFKY